MTLTMFVSVCIVHAKIEKVSFLTRTGLMTAWANGKLWKYRKFDATEKH